MLYAGWGKRVRFMHIERMFLVVCGFSHKKNKHKHFDALFLFLKVFQNNKRVSLVQFPFFFFFILFFLHRKEVFNSRIVDHRLKHCFFLRVIKLAVLLALPRQPHILTINHRKFPFLKASLPSKSMGNSRSKTALLVFDCLFL